ncbi:hypothetical protein [Halomonas sp. M4R1S46]|uniref:hypothetical protein n=1 Tax=Halomonas sp. M4R1S46 TaxID=2982692 RepID=UPI0021E49AEE|nr:hypothetical protein [Halomonas sp. M4R1S46]UYG08557.1 hypothetical protein OCT48_04260 [Halomonas sp. M4R1S46]
MQDAFDFIGQAFGQFIRYLVDALLGFFDGLDDAVSGFIQGTSDTLGIAPTLLSLLVLAFGLWLLWKALRAIMRQAIIVALIWAFLGATVLSWLIH